MKDASSDLLGRAELVSLIGVLVEDLRKHVDYLGDFSVETKTREKFSRLTSQMWPTGSSYEQNLRLRKKIAGQIVWPKCYRIRSKRLCNWIISDWGKTKQDDSLDDKTTILLNKQIKKWNSNAATGSVSLPLSRVASWSKVLALAYPDQCAIYDSRTIYSLNWLILRANLSRDQDQQFKYWPFVTGRNALRGMFAFHGLCTAVSLQQTTDEAGVWDISNLPQVFRKNCQIKPGDAYWSYCQVLKGLAARAFPRKQQALLKTEMLLFSAAREAVPRQVAEFLMSAVSTITSQEAVKGRRESARGLAIDG